MSRIFLFAAIGISLIVSCDYFTSDIYYTNKGAMDYKRIPLIKPYHVMRTDGDWSLKFKYEYMIDGNSFKVEKLNVLDSVIIIYHEPELKSNTDTLASWAFLVPGDSTEVRFNNIKEFKDSLSFYTAKPASFIPVSTIWEKFEQTGFLEWFPIEYNKGK
ncbi:hypothetical protein BH11BAC2_BH11BAC2_08610 [soil metagenome]